MGLDVTDEEMKEKVIRHDFEFQTLTKSLTGIVRELHEITTSMKSVAVIHETISNMDKNLKDSFNRVYSKIEENENDIKDIKSKQDNTGCNALNLKVTEINALNRTIYGKDGRGGLVFDIEDIKKFMYKAMGAFTFINIALAVVVAITTK